MDFAAIIIMLLVLFTLVGVLVFLVWDYIKFKNETKSGITQATTDLTREKSERLSNMKYMVDQVNTVNTDIYNTFSSNLNTYNNQLSTMTSSNNLLSNSLDQFFKLRVGDNNLQPLMSPPGAVQPDLQLMRNVTAISGMNITQLSSNVSMQFCSALDKNRCIRFPDANGNTYLTSMYPNSQVVIDGNTLFKSKVTYASAADNSQYAEVGSFGTNNKDTLFKSTNNMMLQATAGGVGIARTPLNPPEAMLHVAAPNEPTVDVFKAVSAAPGSGQVKITNDGTLVVDKIQIGSDSQAQPILLYKNPTSKKLVLTSPTGIEVQTPGNTTAFSNGVTYAVAPTTAATTTATTTV